MSELLNSLHDEAPAKSWAQEVAEAEAAEAAPAPETAPADPAPERTAAQDAAPAPAPAAPEAEEHDDRRVPLKALQEERAKRAEYERKLADYERRMAELEQRTKAPEPPAEAEPDPETDPIGALKHAREQLRRMQEETQRQQYEAQLNTIAYNAAVQFQQQAPDYQDAYKYAIASRAQELKVLGTDEAAIPQIIKREEMSLVDTAVRQGRNPAEAIYQFAKARGYAMPTPVAAAPAPVAAPTPDPALQQAKKAVAASASAGGASAPKGELTDAEMANLKGAAFDAAWNKRFGGSKSSMFRE